MRLEHSTLFVANESGLLHFHPYVLCEPTTRTADLASHITIFGAQLFNMASAVQSRLDYHCNAIHMRSVPVEVIRIGR